MLLKTVVSAIPLYGMSSFLLPQNLCNQIDSQVRWFWWGYKADKTHYLSLLSGKKICRPTHDGGIGIRLMKDSNLALLSKVAWLMSLSSPRPWVHCLKAKYLRNTALFTAESKPSSSWFWKGLLKSRPLISRGRCFLVANGSSICTWTDPWVPGLRSFRPLPHPHLQTIDPLSLVQSFIIPHSNLWNCVLLETTFNPSLASQIMTIPLPFSREADRIIWAPEPSGVFSVKSACRMVLLEGDPLLARSPPIDWKCLWKLVMHESRKFFLCKVAWDALPTRVRIVDKFQGNFQESLLCPLCGTSNESLPHLFFFCSFSRFIQRSAPWPLSVDLMCTGDIHRWLYLLLDPSRLLGIPASQSHHFQLFAAIAMDFIWWARNTVIHEDSQLTPSQLFRQILKTSTGHLKAWGDFPRSSRRIPANSLSLGNFHKMTFDVVIRQNFSMVAAVLFHSNGSVLRAWTSQSSLVDPLLGEAEAAFMANL